MTPEYTAQLATELLLAGLFIVLGTGLFATLLALVHVRRNRASRLEKPRSASLAPAYRPSLFEQSCRWLVVKGGHLAPVQTALGLHNPIPCSWGEGLSCVATHKLFVSPPVKGWIMVVGQSLPDPSEDIDRCFHFITRFSRVLGQVQFFYSNRALNHHAWVQADRGQIVRAYAWAGETLWDQGKPTQAEIDLGLKCFAYGETAGAIDVSAGESAVPNAERVTALAGRWSFDPTTVDERMLRTGIGVAGDSTCSAPRS
ncbi:MAG: hypothetical protein U1G07_22525 [Verrucomicrobiota bacterium]